MDEEQKKLYRVKAGKVWSHLKAGDTVKLTPTEAAPFPEELEEVPADEATADTEEVPTEPAA